MREYHAIITVQANNWFDAERAFDAAIGDDDRLSLVRLASVPPDTSGEPHPRLEAERPGVGYPEFFDTCTCGSGAMDGHAYTCKLRRSV